MYGILFEPFSTRKYDICQNKGHLEKLTTHVLHCMVSTRFVGHNSAAGSNPMETYKQERMYQAALLKIAMKMKRKDEIRGFDELFLDILREMKLDPDEFRRYVNTHMESLMATVKQRGY
jgi:hypothetical protein